MDVAYYFDDSDPNLSRAGSAGVSEGKRSIKAVPPSSPNDLKIFLVMEQDQETLTAPSM
jgi:hypothetical protein